MGSLGSAFNVLLVSASQPRKSPTCTPNRKKRLWTNWFYMISRIKRRKFGDGNSVKVDRLIGFKLSAASTKSPTIRHDKPEGVPNCVKHFAQ